jgi:hypothetical protein
MILVLFCLEPVFGEQSLADFARKEAERRKLIDLQGMETREISSDKVQKQGSGGLTTSRLPTERRAPPVRETGAQRQIPISSFRNPLKKLDGEIRQCEDRMTGLKERIEADKRILPRLNARGVDTSAAARERKLSEFRDLELKLKRLRQDRREHYDAGLKAGYLPGELDGHGSMP